MNYLIGIGNYTCGDDGIGPRLIEAICDRGLDAGFCALELPGHGIDLLSHFTDETGVVVVIDCASMGLPPGSLRVFEPDEVESHGAPLTLSTHDNDILSLITFARQAGCRIPPIRIVAIQPDAIALGDELSDSLQTQFETYLARVCAEMHSLALNHGTD